jgi:hypothetical protein
MARFNTRGGRTPKAPTSFIQSERTASGTTALGAPGFARNPTSELFLLAVANFVGRDEFHEEAAARDERFKALVRKVAVSDPDWMCRFVPWLRGNANMRTAPMIAAAEAVWARRDAGMGGGRKIVRGALQRADEPGEAVAYWIEHYGANLPRAFERGVADAVKGLYNEYSLLKYDTDSKGIRFGGVLKLTHPRLTREAARQAIGREDYTDEQLDDWLMRTRALYQYACDRVDGVENLLGEETLLPMIRANIVLRSRAAEDPLVLLDPEAVREAGLTWQNVLSLAGSKLPKNKLWEAVIPSMGYFALLQNLRNFDEAGVSDAVARQVCERIRDPRNVARSRLFPYRFLSAYRAVSSLRWGQALEEALNHSLSNIPELSGSTLILVDRSNSMFPHYSGVNKDGVSRADQAAIFGTALALRASGRAQLVQFGDTSAEVRVAPGESVLRAVSSKFNNLNGTEIRAALQAWYRGHDRVVLITDEQTHLHRAAVMEDSIVPARTPIYTWNLGGYQYGHNASHALRYTFGGLTDSAFKLIPLLEAGESQTWPF